MFCFLFRSRKKRIASAISRRAPSATPTPTPALAPELRPEGSVSAAGAVGAPDPALVEDAPPPPFPDVELEDELEVCVGIPVVGKVRGVDVREEVGGDVGVVLTGMSEAWKLSWYSGANRT
jgi:hypothetical protein